MKYIRSDEKEEGVVGAITLMLVLAVISVLFAYYVGDIVPSQMSQYEYSMDQTLMSQQDIALSQMVQAVSAQAYGTPVFISYTTESSFVSVFSTPSYATAYIEKDIWNQSYSYYLYIPSSQTGFPTSYFNGGGAVVIYNGNRYYQPADYVLGDGSVYGVTSSGSFAIGPSYALTYNPGSDTYRFIIMNIYGGPFAQGGTGTVDFKAIYSGGSVLSTSPLPAPVTASLVFYDKQPAEILYSEIASLSPSISTSVSGGHTYYVISITIPRNAVVQVIEAAFGVSPYGAVL